MLAYYHVYVNLLSFHCHTQYKYFAMTIKSTEFDIRICKNILVPRFDTFGDIVLLEGLIKALLDFLPEARITLLVREGYDQLASLFPERLIWKTTRINPYKKPCDIDEVKSLLEGLREDSYDLLLTTTYNHTWPDDLPAAALTSARRVAIGEERAMNDWVAEILPELDLVRPENLYHDYIVVEEKSHETDKYQKLWESVTGKTDFIPKPKLAVPEHINKEAAVFLTKNGLAKGTFVFCFPAGISNISLKTWPADKYAEAIAHLERTYSLKSLIAAHESEKDIAEEVAALARSCGAAPAIWLGRDGEIPLACALAKQSAFYLGNDTGLMHMAAALEKPVVAIFGGGTWPRFLPCANVGRIFVTLMPCFYCMWDCILGHPFCITYLTMEHIMPEIENLLLEISHGRKTFKIIETKLKEDHPYLVLARTVGERIAKEQDTARQMREWAERTEQFLVQERETSNQMREWAERAEQFLVQERETSNQMREWAERAEQFLVQERETSNQMRESAERTEQLIVGYEKEIMPLRAFAQRFRWLYHIYLRLRREV
jgi:ADP-heptose:LPS heptosyltransferase